MLKSVLSSTEFSAVAGNSIDSSIDGVDSGVSNNGAGTGNIHGCQQCGSCRCLTHCNSSRSLQLRSWCVCQICSICRSYSSRSLNIGICTASQRHRGITNFIGILASVYLILPNSSLDTRSRHSLAVYGNRLSGAGTDLESHLSCTITGSQRLDSVKVCVVSDTVDLFKQLVNRTLQVASCNGVVGTICRLGSQSCQTL